MSGACVLLSYARDRGDRAATGLLQAHLEAAAAFAECSRSCLLVGVDGRDVAVVVSTEPEVPAKLAAGCAHSALVHRVAGVDPEALHGDETAAGYLDLVLDRADPPVPFDDPVVSGIIQSLYRTYLPLLGRRYRAGTVLWHDGVRIDGSWLAFTAADDHQARRLAADNPWRRLAPGFLLRLPGGLIATSRPPAGPETQRSGMFACGKARSVPEPGYRVRG
jgi:hypothetical protein